jgi:hypothetical protein
MFIKRRCVAHPQFQTSSYMFIETMGRLSGISDFLFPGEISFVFIKTRSVKCGSANQQLLVVSIDIPGRLYNQISSFLI